MSSSFHDVKMKDQFKIGIDIDITIPPMTLSDGGSNPVIASNFVSWEFVSLAYNRSTVNAITLQLFFKHQNGKLFKIREEVGFTGNDFFYMLEHPLTSDVHIVFKTVGAGGGENHGVMVFYK